MEKTLYETNILPRLNEIAQWAKSGCTTGEIAKKLEVSTSTFTRYLDRGQREERYQPLLEAYRPGADQADGQVEAALHKRACGMETEERVYEKKPNPDTGELEEICTKRVTKTTPPHPASAMFWLANRCPEKWQHRPKEKLEAEEGGVVLMPDQITVFEE